MAQDVVPIAPLPTPGGGGGEGSAELAADLIKGFAPVASPPDKTADAVPSAPKEQTPQPAKEPPKEPPKEVPKQTSGQPPKSATPPPKDLDPDDPKVNAADLRRELKRVKDSVNLSVQQRDTQIRELTDKIRGFENKRFWTDDDLRLHEAANKRLAQMESELYSRDYATSPEYKQKYQDRLDDVWKEASEEITGMTVRMPDGVDEAGQPKFTERPATTKDLMAVIDAPASERIAIAKKLFGDEKEPVVDWARQIAVIRKEAAKAIEDKRAGYASELTKRNQQFEEANQKITTFIQQATNHLEKTLPDVFTAPPDQPEAADALRKGFAFVDESSAKMMEMDINTRAARAAVVRSMAGAFPRLLQDNTKLRGRVKELEEQIGKYQKTDPSELGGGGGGGNVTGSKDGGSDEMAAEIEALTRK